jgi:hypothetical protein
MRSALIVAAMAMLVSANSSAQPVPHRADIMGPGTISCGKWIEQRREAGVVMYGSEDWVLGFLSGYNEYSSTDGRLTSDTDADGAMTWLDNYCQAHPLDKLATATTALVAALEARRR